MTHEVVQELLPAYALGAIDKNEESLIVAHLDECPACRTLLDDYQTVSADLLYTVPLIAAPPGLTEDLRLRIARPRPQAQPRRATCPPKAAPGSSLSATCRPCPLERPTSYGWCRVVREITAASSRSARMVPAFSW